jgi:hypothetical protein
MEEKAGSLADDGKYGSEPAQGTIIAGGGPSGECPSDVLHPFGGCNDSLSQYKIIGRALIMVEQESLVYGYGSQRAVQEFRERVASVSVEMLESYLEDLLDSQVALDLLYIARPGFWKSVDLLTVISLLGSCAVGTYVSLTSGAPLVGLSSTLLLALPVVTVWHRSPFGHLARRVSFARIVSKEVARRRGSDKDGSAESANTGFSLRTLLGGEPEAVGSAPARRTNGATIHIGNCSGIFPISSSSD